MIIDEADEMLHSEWESEFVDHPFYYG
jgi:hypothetical protein